MGVVSLGLFFPFFAFLFLYFTHFFLFGAQKAQKVGETVAPVLEDAWVKSQPVLEQVCTRRCLPAYFYYMLYSIVLLS